MLRREIAGVAERLRGLGEALEGQRLAMIEHVRRLTLAGEETARRNAEERAREVRVARDLLVRFAEGSDQVAQEPPL